MFNGVSVNQPRVIKLSVFMVVINNSCQQPFATLLDVLTAFVSRISPNSLADSRLCTIYGHLATDLKSNSFIVKSYSRS